MRLRVLAVGQKMPAWVDQGVNEYARRMPRDFSVDWQELAPAKRGNGSATRYREQEADAILSRVSQADTLVALDVAGLAVSTESALTPGRWTALSPASSSEGRTVSTIRY